MVILGVIEVLVDCIMGLVFFGDEVVLIELFYDCYLLMVWWVGGILVCVWVILLYWLLDKVVLVVVFLDKMKVVFLNNFMNLMVKVFFDDEF